MLQLENVKKIYFIGIGGIGMSAVAGLAAHQGFHVDGSDGTEIYAPSKTVLDMYALKYRLGYNASHIEETKPDLIVVGAGQTNENPEIKAAIEQGVPITSFPELLSVFTKDKVRIVVCGTHGKTTTSSLITLFLKACGLNPGYFIGGYVQDLSSNFHYSDGRYFVIEGDEYYSSFFDREPKFLHYQPNILVLNNIEMDHYDYFDSKEKLLETFQRLVNSMPASGVVIANADDENVQSVLKNCQKQIVWYSSIKGEADYYGQFLGFSDGHMQFSVSYRNESMGEFMFSKPGEHYMKNCLAALAVARYYDCDAKKLRSVVKKFQGPKRRFEYIGTLAQGVIVIDDYAHHPTAVFSTLDAAKKMYPKKKLFAVFEPHTFTRTKATLLQLASSFTAADEVIIPDIYPAREQHLEGLIHAREVVEALKKHHSCVHYLPTRQEVLEYLLSHVKKGDVVIIMAVGDFHNVAEELTEKLKLRRVGERKSL